MTKILNKTQLDEAVDILQNGQVVAFPTDTVFGVGCRCDDPAAFLRMKQAKGRPDSKPFPLMVADYQQMCQVAYCDERVEKIASRFMPGGLTLVLNKKDYIPDELTCGKSTIAIRIPDDEFVLALLKRTGPLFVTSANLSDYPSCNTTEEVMSQLDGRIAAVVEGEAYSHVASTIIDCTGEELKCLREGQLSIETIENALL